MSDSINEQRCEHGKTADDAHERNGDTCFHPFDRFDRCPGPSVVTPPAQISEINDRLNRAREFFLQSDEARRQLGLPTIHDDLTQTKEPK